MVVTIGKGDKKGRNGKQEQVGHIDYLYGLIEKIEVGNLNKVVDCKVFYGGNIVRQIVIDSKDYKRGDKSENTHKEGVKFIDFEVE